MSPAQDPAQPDAGPIGIGGWLIAPIVLLAFMIVAAGFQLTAFPALAEVAGGLPKWKLYLLSTIVLLNAVLGIICPAILLVLLFRKARRFPRFFLQWAIVYVVFVVANHFMVVVVFSDVLGDSWSARLTPEALRSLFLSVVPVAVFIPYILQSRRVRNTFVK